MHELGIASSILDAVRAEAAAHRPARPVKVGIRIGELAGIDPNSLSFCFEILVKDSGLEPLALAIEPGATDDLEFAYLELEEP
ncbi:MAG TPA: hydrogenase maturation nickel metallochaperone HypA [Candidatus Sulfopaludibacter sp.]|nr:hydrogenase maturation nickel metallochaperone HypA [Candidatus Sulfopaludibacter sp.]